MSRIYAGILGSLAFVTVTLRGLAHQAGVESTLYAAAVQTLLFGLIGFGLGKLAEVILLDSVRASMLAEIAQRKQPAAAAPSGNRST